MASTEKYYCYGQCGKTFSDLDNMERVEGIGDLSPRYFCEDCAEEARSDSDKSPSY